MRLSFLFFSSFLVFPLPLLPTHAFRRQPENRLRLRWQICHNMTKLSLRQTRDRTLKNVIWVGDALEQVRHFPQMVRRKIGEALRFAQYGGKHPRAKPLRGLGSGVFEIAAPYDTDTYRAVYAVAIGDNIYVLHAFQKKSTRGIQTPKHEIDLMKQRLRMAQAMEDEHA